MLARFQSPAAENPMWKAALVHLLLAIVASILEFTAVARAAFTIALCLFAGSVLIGLLGLLAGRRIRL